MWKKIVPIAVVLLVAWVGLNLITGSDDTEPDADATASNTESTDNATAESASVDTTSDIEQTAETEESGEQSSDIVALADSSSSGTEVATEDSIAAGSESDTVAASDTETATDADAASDTETATDTDAATDTETATDTDAASDTETATDADAASDTETATDADAASDTETATDADAASDTETATESDATSDTETASDTDTASDTETVAASAASGNDAAAADNVQMRYPVDPETGATLYDQGMVEVTIEPTPEPEDTSTDSGEVAESASGDTEAAASADEEGGDVAADEQDSNEAEPVEEVATEMRYLTDPVTGATDYEGGMVEVPVVVTVQSEPETTDDEQGNTEESDSQAANETQIEQFTEGQLPSDPVTGATIYEEKLSDDSVELAVKEELTTTETSDTSNRLPVDPETGATIYPSESAGEEEQTADNAESSNRLPTDPETGATIHSATDSSEARSESTSSQLAQPADLSGVSRMIGGVFGNASVALQQAKDEESATAALPRLEMASESLSEVINEVQSLPESSNNILGKVVSRHLARITPLADTAVVQPGVGAVLNPVLQPMIEQLHSLAK